MKRIARMCKENQVAYRILSPSSTDISNNDRVKNANNLYTKNPKTILVSIRLNKKQAEADEVFTESQGVSTYYYRKGLKFWQWGKEEPNVIHSKKLARVFLHYLVKGTGFPKRGIKHSKHQMLVDLTMPAIITRSGFVNHLEECKKLLSCDFREQIAKAHFDAMLLVSGQGLKKVVETKLEDLRLTASDF